MLNYVTSNHTHLLAVDTGHSEIPLSRHFLYPLSKLKKLTKYI